MILSLVITSTKKTHTFAGEQEYNIFHISLSILHSVMEKNDSLQLHNYQLPINNNIFLMPV